MIFGVGEKSTSSENQIFKSCRDYKADYLLFFDSRALATNEPTYKDTILFHLIEILNQNNISYIAISRPKNVTIFATLFNFLNLNPKLQFKFLITNLGFVDCTPKKQEIIDDMLLQVNQFVNFNNKIISKEKYILSGGGADILKVFEYSAEYLSSLNATLIEKFDKIFLLNTPVVDRNINIKRKRPSSFFEQIDATNCLIEQIAQLSQKYKIIDIKSHNETFDAVHFTKKEHIRISSKIIKELNL